MTVHTFQATTPVDSHIPGCAPVVQVTIAIGLGPLGQPALGSAHQTAHSDDPVSDADEFTSVPSTAPTPTVPGDVAMPAVQANGHSALAG